MNPKSSNIRITTFHGALSTRLGRPKKYAEVTCCPDFSDSQLVVYNRGYVCASTLGSQSIGGRSSVPASPSPQRVVTRSNSNRRISLPGITACRTKSGIYVLPLTNLFYLALPHHGRMRACWSRPILWFPVRRSISSCTELNTTKNFRKRGRFESVELAVKPIALKLYFESGKTAILRFAESEVRDQCVTVLNCIVQANKVKNGYPDFEYAWPVVPRIHAKDPSSKGLLPNLIWNCHYFCLMESEAILFYKDVRAPVMIVPFPFVRQCTSQRDGQFILHIGRGAPTGACKLSLRLSNGSEAEQLHKMFARLLQQSEIHRRRSSSMGAHEYLSQIWDPLPLPNAAPDYNLLDFPWIDDSDSEVRAKHVEGPTRSNPIAVTTQRNQSACSVAESGVSSDPSEYVNLEKASCQQIDPKVNDCISRIATESYAESLTNPETRCRAQVCSLRSIKRKSSSQLPRYVEMTNEVPGLPTIHSTTDSGVISFSSNRNSNSTDFVPHSRANSHRLRTYSSPWPSTLHAKRRPRSHREDPELFAAVTFAPHPVVLSERASDSSVTSPFSVTLVKPSRISLIHSSPTSTVTSPVLRRMYHPQNLDEMTQPKAIHDLAATKRPILLRSLVRVASGSFHNGPPSSPEILPSLINSLFHPEQTMESLCCSTHLDSRRSKKSSVRNSVQAKANPSMYEHKLPQRPRANTVSASQSVGQRLTLTLVNIGARFRQRSKSTGSSSMDRSSYTPSLSIHEPKADELITHLPSQFRWFASPYECDERTYRAADRTMSVSSVSALNLSDHYLVYECF